MLNFHYFASLLTLMATTVFTFVLPPQKVLAQDYDGDKVRDTASWDESTGIWQIKTDQGTLTVQWGMQGDIPVPADYDGDGITEVAVWRPSNGNWYISTQNLSWANRQGTEKIVQWGTVGDVPLPADYNPSRPGIEIAVHRRSTGTCFISTQNLSWDSRGEAYRINQLRNCGK
ncbi:MAG: VCBS repeat-containing protein [Nostocales cyanobacterium ELA583]